MEERRFLNHDQATLLKREQDMYTTEGDKRGEYFRDYCRILHSNAYRRLKHKTQVFFNVVNDHICTRMEHVNHVESVSHSIAVGLGLDAELTRAIATGHDLGHAPFGHEGETILDSLSRENLSEAYVKENYGEGTEKLFWHEKNGLRFVDRLELLPDTHGYRKNLNLTYAVRDGIISHCGEIDENELKPRDEAIDLEKFSAPGKYRPYTWEGCAVKIADKIAYLGRDIEDALVLNFISEEGMAELKQLSKEYVGEETLNTTGLMHRLIGDIIDNSTPERGLALSHEKLSLLNDVKKYNYLYIYKSPLFDVYKKYAKLVLSSIFDTLKAAYDGKDTIRKIENRYMKIYPKLAKSFTEWLRIYCDGSVPGTEEAEGLKNEKVYGALESEDIYVQAIVDFVSGMTDSYAIELFNELIEFG